MTATVTHYQSGLAGDMERALKLYVGADPWPPVAGVEYTAASIYADYPRLAAFVVAHPSGGNVPTIDAVFINIDEAEARTIARGYSVDPNAHHYGTDHLETDIHSPLVGLPLSQAIWLISKLLSQPRPPLRVQYRSWRHGLIYERIQEISRVQMEKWSACWEDGVLVRELPYSGEAVERLTREAFDRLEYDNDLDAADRCCEQAEAEMVSGCEDIAVRPRRRRQKAARK